MPRSPFTPVLSLPRLCSMDTGAVMATVRSGKGIRRSDAACDDGAWSAIGDREVSVGIRGEGKEGEKVRPPPPPPQITSPDSDQYHASRIRISSPTHFSTSSPHSPPQISSPTCSASSLAGPCSAPSSECSAAFPSTHSHTRRCHTPGRRGPPPRPPC
jgi:hypothetical protein